MHFSYQHKRLQRTFILQEQSSNRTRVIPFEVCVYNGQIDLYPLLSFALQTLKDVHIRIYDFKTNKYIDLGLIGIRFHIPLQILNSGTNVVLLKYHFSQAQTMSMSSYASSVYNEEKSQTGSKKAQRSKQRIILQVIRIVKKWRKLCDNKLGVSMTLAQAAKLIGLPKKSLDDYYYQLRMGEKYGFDYHAHMFQRIGVLRSFLKKYKTHRKGDKNQKIPNVLLIADQIDKYQNKMRQNAEQHEKYINCESIQEENDGAQNSNSLKNQYIEKQFYNEFNYFSGKQSDPFLSLGRLNSEQAMVNQYDNSNNGFELFF